MKQLYKFSTTVFLAILMALGAVTESFAFDCPPVGDQVTYGTNNVWIGYTYQGVNFNTYKGYVLQGNAANPNFDQNFGGDQVNYATNGCSVYTDTFSVRYKLTKAFANGYYDLTVAGDDGYRLSIDGGNTWVINRWSDQSYTSTTTTILLNGTYNLVLEFYERFGQNRITFSVGAGCAPTGDPAVTGTGNVWRGYLYQGNNFNTYRGFITEGTVSSPNFNELFGGANTNFATSSCGVQTENFSARFRLQLNLPAANYVFTVGGDDGYRFSLDGGTTWIINNWNPHSYTSTTYIANLSGIVNMVIEYFENGGDNRVSFAMSSNSSLPVKLTAFSAKSVATDKVQAAWKVSEEVNFSHYVVQRSTGGQAFTDISIVAGQENDVHVETVYHYTDNIKYSELIHYRLKMVDKDGSAEYSGVVTVALNIIENTVKIYPTMVEGNTIYVEMAGSLAQGKVEIVDMNGRIMLSQNHVMSGRQQVSLGNSRLAAGSYLVRVTDGTKLVAGKLVMVK